MEYTSIASYETLMLDYCSPEATVRERARQWCESGDLQVVMSQLIQAIDPKNGSSSMHRAAVILRGRIILEAKKSPGDENGPVGEHTQFIREKVAPEVLRILTQQEDAENKHLASAAAKINELCYDENCEWNDLWQLIDNWLSKEAISSSNGSLKRCIALSLLKELAESPRTLKILEKHSETFIESLSQVIKSPACFNEARAAFATVAAINEGIQETNTATKMTYKILRKKTRAPSQFRGLRKLLRVLVPEILIAFNEIVEYSLKSSSPSEGYENLSLYLTIASHVTESDAEFWRSDVKGLLDILSKVVLAQQIPYHCRQSSLRIIVNAISSSVQSMLSSLSPSNNSQSNATDLAKSGCHLIELLVSVTTSFVESDAEWMKHREDEPLDIDNDDILEFSCFLIGDLLQRSASLVVDEEVIKLAFKLYQSSATPLHSVMGLRLMNQIITERPQSFIKFCDHLMDQLIADLKSADTSTKWTDMRYRWWTFMIICDLCGEYKDEIQSKYLQSLLNYLVNAIKNESVVRCKCRALTAIYSLIYPIDHEETKSFILTNLDALLCQLVVPAIQNENGELKELGFAVATALVEACGDQFSSYYKDFIEAVQKILTGAILGFQSNEKNNDLLLCDSAMSFIVKLCEEMDYERCKDDIICLLDQILMICQNFAEQTERQDVQNNITIHSLLDHVGALTVLAGRDAVTFLDRTMTFLFPILIATDTPLLKTTTTASDMLQEGAAAAAVDLFVLNNITRGKIECQESQRTTQISVKGKGGVERTFEFNFDLIEGKEAGFDALAKMIDAVRSAFIPYIPKTLEVLLEEIHHNYFKIKENVVKCMKSLLNCLLPDETELRVPRHQSKCALATGLISSDDFFQLAISLVTKLLDIMNQRLDKEAAKIVTALEDMFESIWEASYFFPMTEHPEATTFLEHVFIQFGKKLVMTVTVEIESMDLETTTTTECTSGWTESAGSATLSSSTTDSEFADVYGMVYSGIMRCVGSLLKVFKEKCVPLFEVHLNTAYSGLLTIPTANKSGRAAALCVFALIIEYSGEDFQHRFASEFLDLALTYCKCNDLKTDKLKQIHQSDEDNLDWIAEDVDRVQAAAYAVGIVAQRVPTIFLPRLETGIRQLNAVLQHPFAACDDRGPASECAVGALIKICTSPYFRQPLVSFGFGNDFLIQLIANWMPFQHDEDESRGITDVLINLILNNQLDQELMKDCGIISELKRVLICVREDSIKNPNLLFKDTLVSGKLDEAIHILQNLI